MNLVYGEVIQIFPDCGVLMAKIRAGGAMKSIPLLTDAEVGDRVLICDGAAIGRLHDGEPAKAEESAKIE